MPVYDGVNGVVRKRKEWPIGIDGVVRQQKEHWVGIDGGQRKIFSSKKKLELYSVGDLVPLKVQGISVDWLVCHKGMPSDKYYNCDGVWLVMNDCYNMQAHSNPAVSNFSASNIYQWLNQEFYSYLDVSVQQSISSTQKIPFTFNGGVFTGKSGLSAKVFLLSYTELGFPDDPEYTFSEGDKLDYFPVYSRSSSQDNVKRVSKFNGSPVNYHLRTPRATSEYSGWNMQCTSRGLYYSDRSTQVCGIRPVIILPYSFEA